MKNKLFLFKSILLLFALIISNIAFTSSQFSILSDSGIRYPKYLSITDSLINLNNNFPLTTKIIKLGKTKRGLEQIALMYSKNFPPKQLVMMTGATHGNEYLNIVDRLTEKMVKNPNKKILDYLDRGGAILFLPILNPEGFSKRRRSGARNKDLNRDFPNSDISLTGLKNEETKNLVSYISNLTSSNQIDLKLVIDYHCCNGSLLYPWSYTKTRIPQIDLTGHQEIAKLMQKYLPDYIHGITGEVLGYFPKGTSKDFWYQEFRALAFTFEGKVRLEHLNLQKHYLWWSDILSTIN